jgi:hypothetical protein
MEAKDIAREFIIPYFNVRGDFFDTAWDFVNANFDKISSVASSSQGIKSIGGPLSFGGHEEHGAVKAIIIFADGFKEMPLEGNFSSFVDSIKSACGKYHAEEGLTKEILKKVNSLENRIEKFLKPEAIKRIAAKEEKKSEYVVFLPSPGGIKTFIDNKTKTEEQAHKNYATKKEKFDIFIYEQNVYKKVMGEGKAKMISLNPSISFRGLLILFLKYKDVSLPYVELYHKAFCETAEHKSDAEEPGDVMNTLKNAVNELKRELDYIKGFSIPRAKNSAYKCEGGFQFCLILKRPTNEHYTMLFKKKFKFAESIPEEV